MIQPTTALMERTCTVGNLDHIRKRLAKQVSLKTGISKTIFNVTKSFVSSVVQQDSMRNIFLVQCWLNISPKIISLSFTIESHKKSVQKFLAGTLF